MTFISSKAEEVWGMNDDIARGCFEHSLVFLGLISGYDQLEEGVKV